MVDNNRNLQAPPTWVTTAGFGFLTLNSVLAIYRSWGDHVSMLFVAGSYAMLLLLFRCIRERGRRTVWRVTTLVTLSLGVVNCDMTLEIYCSWGDRVSMLFVAGSYATLLLLFRCLRDYERAAPGRSPARGRGRRAVWPVTALLTLSLAVVNCEMAIDIHRVCSFPGSATFVLVAYAALLALGWIFVREFAD